MVADARVSTSLRISAGWHNPLKPERDKKIVKKRLRLKNKRIGLEFSGKNNPVKLNLENMMHIIYSYISISEIYTCKEKKKVLL